MTSPLTMILVADELAFPAGGASSVYVRRFARAAALGGAEPVVLCLDYSERGILQNTAANGAYREVSFEYLTGDPVLPKKALEISRGRLRAWTALGGALDRWSKGRRAVVVYYGRFPSVLLPLHRACAARGLPLVANVVEWRPAFRDQTLQQRLGDRAFHKWLPRLDGSIVISRFIESALRELGAKHPILRVPILSDPDEWAAPTPLRARRPYVLLCADFDSYPEDAKLAIDAMKHVPTGFALELVGKAAKQRPALERHARLAMVDARVRFEDRFVTDDELRARYRAASALIAPLHDDDRSRARFPSKLADYLYSGRPFVSSSIGEVGAYLVDGENAFLCRPDDPASLGEAIVRATTQNDRDAIAARGRELALGELDIGHQGKRITAWLDDLAVSR
ncbi:hypothetical protein BH09MYX1_BH09MYX1_07800 [soil metagenome]